MEEKIMKYIKKNNPCYQNEVGKKLKLKEGVLSKYMCRLEKDGKIIREKCMVPVMETNLFAGTYKSKKNTKKVMLLD
jgi:DNA-binding Lrp family transcriptional regulator